MTLGEAVEAIQQRWLDEWVDGSNDPLTASAFDDEPFDADSVDDPWVRLTIRHTGSEQATAGPVGGRNFDRTGIVLAQVFTLTGTGRDDDGASGLSADDLAQTARAVFEAVRVSGTSLVFFAGTTREGDVDGRWAMTTVEVPFRYRETK